MQEKIRDYLDSFFDAFPHSKEVQDAKEELYINVLKCYNDALAEGMDEKDASDSAIDGIEGLCELFGELNSDIEKGCSESYTQGKSIAGNTADFIDNVSDFTSGLVSGSFTEDDSRFGPVELMNTVTLSLDGIQNVEISYVSESLQLFYAEGAELVVKEYLNQNDSTLFANVNISDNSILLSDGRRRDVFALRSRVEVYLPANYAGSLSLATLHGGIASSNRGIASSNQWNLASFSARSTHGEVNIASVEAASIYLSSTSGPLQVAHASGNMDIHSITGSINVETAKGGGIFRTISGSMNINFTELRSDVTLSAVAGGIHLKLPQKTSFEFTSHSISGTIDPGFDVCYPSTPKKVHFHVGNAPYYQVNAVSTSSNIYVNII